MSARKLEDGLGNLERAVANLERAPTIPTDGERVAANDRDIAKVTPLIRTTFDFLAQRCRTS
ncbi:hypothetical protein [Methylobacterium sp. WL120]|uniref:hypothetical protein n=1 Tax=Methylobacterium sp. WL120 TaxID=2603887 RepID=UPI0011CBE323|nr:hypothetical protein [Methylobacterium sp. WL120]TXM67359.1 hypothetical protein FV229_10315 [Methylobacterium sp. WL120]